MEVSLIVNDFLRRAAALYPDKTAIVDGAKRFSYREYQHRANQLSNALLSLGVGKGDRVCILSPNSHLFLESFYGTSQIGAILVPLSHPDRQRHDIRARPRFAIAGAPPPAAFIQKLEGELGFEFIQLYGLTETAPLLTISRPDFATRADDWPRRARAGVPGLGVELEVRDENDEPVPRDGETIGEICARSNVVFAGYWEQPDQTSEAIHDGWFHTGDLAVWDESNSFHIVDRKKDIIISGGENISSPEIEDTLYQHPFVLECAVIGVPHEKWGETPRALVVLRPGDAPSEAALIEFCRTRLAHFKCPTSVEFVRDLPRTVTGKLQKYKLRERYWGSRGNRRIN